MSFLNDDRGHIASFAYSLPEVRIRLGWSGHPMALSKSFDTGEFTSLMEENRPAILIAEDQIFIALEAERILTEAFDCAVEICRRDRLDSALSEKAFNIVILEFSGIAPDDQHYAFLVRGSGAELVLLNGGGDPADVGKTFPGVPLINKPFNEAHVRQVLGSLVLRKEAT